ncbi:MAG TPA: GNAT family N-acetyltransferase [Novosphingobium sp.]|nr:GNAT family N-acetyltransferase [Novosphingobium sp.]
MLDLYQHLNPGDERPRLDLAAQALDRFMTYPGSGIFVGEADAVMVCSCTLIVVPNLTRGGRPFGLIENVVTHRDFRRRGFGARILEAASAGCYKVMLMTGSTSPETLSFYAGAGFEQSKTGFQKRRIAVRTDA